jgi:hypothetical protein
MKTTKRTSLNKRIEKLNLQKNSIVGNMICDMKKGDKLRPIYSQGSSWKYSSLIDKSQELKDTLKTLGIEFTTGNDAARGGKTGYFVEITTKIID